MESWMNEINLAMRISDPGVTKDMLEGIAGSTLIMNGGYKILEKSEIISIQEESL